MGPIEQGIVKQAIKTGQPIPDRIQNAPVLATGLLFYIQAFFDLDSAREQGWSLGRIPWMAVQQYAVFYDLDHDQNETLHYLIREMDIEYLKYRKDKAPKDDGRPSGFGK